MKSRIGIYEADETAIMAQLRLNRFLGYLETDYRIDLPFFYSQPLIDCLKEETVNGIGFSVGTKNKKPVVSAHVGSIKLPEFYAAKTLEDAGPGKELKRLSDYLLAEELPHLNPDFYVRFNRFLLESLDLKGEATVSGWAGIYLEDSGRPYDKTAECWEKEVLPELKKSGVKIIFEFANYLHTMENEGRFAGNYKRHFYNTMFLLRSMLVASLNSAKKQRKAKIIPRGNGPANRKTVSVFLDGKQYENGLGMDTDDNGFGAENQFKQAERELKIESPFTQIFSNPNTLKTLASVPRVLGKWFVEVPVRKLEVY